MKTFQSISILFLLSLFIIAMMQLPADGKAFEVVRYYGTAKPGSYRICYTIDLKIIKWTWCVDRDEPTPTDDTGGAVLDGPPEPGGIG